MVLDGTFQKTSERACQTFKVLPEVKILENMSAYRSRSKFENPQILFTKY